MAPRWPLKWAKMAQDGLKTARKPKGNRTEEEKEEEEDEEENEEEEEEQEEKTRTSVRRRAVADTS